MSEEKNTNKKSTVTISLPKFAFMKFESLFLVLIIIAGLLQTVELFGLRSAVASANTGVSTTKTTTSGSAQGGSTTQLPEMVGGC